MRIRRSTRVLGLAAAVAAGLTAAAPPIAAQVAAQVAAQGVQAAPTMSSDDLRAFARVYLDVARARDSADVRYAALRTKTPQEQAAIQSRMREQVAEILHHAGMSEDQYRQKTFVVSTVDSLRTAFDDIVAEITGVPRPGQGAAPSSAPAQATVSLPEGPAGAHIGHVLNAFGDTPERAGLLPIALAEARIAAQHAANAARTPENLDAMKLHAGHVIHAVDPTVVAMGPGRGYGVKRAALGVASHIELAAGVDGAPPAVVTHAVHVATAARNTMQRADSLVALAQRVRNATSAPEAADLVSQLVSLADQLIAGRDANADGRITWAAGEGGLQHAQEHMELMVGNRE